MTETLTTTIQGLAHDGRGIAKGEQKTIFIAGGLPGEVVTYCITKKHRHYLEGKILSTDATSKMRTQPPCEHFNECGGCSLQHIQMSDQIQFKQQYLLDQLERMGKVKPRHLLPPLSAHPLGYRRKARLGVKWVHKKNKLLIGFREKSGRYLADLSHCLVLHPAVGEKFNVLSELIASLEAYQAIPQIEVAMGDQQVALVFRHLTPLSPQDESLLLQFGTTHQFDIYLHPNSPEPIRKLWPTDTPARLSYTLPDEQLTFLFYPLDFTQVNLEINRLMVAQALTLLDLSSQDRVLDLYCGIGNFTLPMAKRAKHVVGIEGSQEMVSRAQENTRHNHLHNVEFFAANLDQPQPTVLWLNQQYDKLLLDPPRIGAAAILEYVPIWQPKRIVYISCNPATLARDANTLVNSHKYSLQKAGIMNMFPHTSHVEAVAVFDREE
jgi:23S rRNA (uracil1939-C5)-methyltransferase